MFFFPERELDDPYQTAFTLTDHIPPLYKYNSYLHRQTLLAGLIDRYGKLIQDNRISLITPYESLSLDIEYLALSLGLMATTHNHTVEIWGTLSLLPTRQITAQKDTFHATLQPFTVTPVGQDLYYGFELEGDPHFLLGDFTVTHNSTAMMAVLFALYGTGTKLTTVGKTSCEVELHFDDLYITRTKRPNRLVLVNHTTGAELEDDAAQAVINERFGTAFEATSYVPQNALKSFILMGPLEKLEFLEKFAFQGVDLSSLKSRTQAAIRKQNDILVETTSKLEMASTHLQTLPVPVHCPFPFPTKNPESSSKNELIRLKNTRVLIKRAEERVQTLTQQLASYKIYISEKTSKQERETELLQRMAKVTQDRATIPYRDDTALRNYQKQLQLILSRKELITLQERYAEDMKRLDTMKETEEKERETILTTIQDTLWKDHSEQELNTLIVEYENVLSDLERLSTLQKTQKSCSVNLEKLNTDRLSLLDNRERLTLQQEKLSKLRLQAELYECPSCHASLQFTDNQLQLSAEEKLPDMEASIEETERVISQTLKTVQRLERLIPDEESKHKRYTEISDEITALTSKYEELPSKQDASSTLEYLREYKQTQRELERKQRDLKGPIRFSSTVELFKAQVAKQKTTIQTLQTTLSTPVEFTEEQVRELIESEKHKKIQVEGLEQTLTELTRDLQKVRDALQKLNQTYKETGNIPKNELSLETELTTATDELKELRTKLELHEKNVSLIEKYNKYKEELTRYTEWEDKVKTLTLAETTERHRYTASLLLKDKILEAESIAILNIINSINAHAQEYLEHFFPNDPIVVRLLPFKQTKKSAAKPQINLEIDYKGMEADLTMLSGGELARVILAYTLALAEIFNSPMLMLDESTASLDQEATSTVMEGIRKNFSSKLVVVIAHQVISGDFDRLITLS